MAQERSLHKLSIYSNVNGAPTIYLQQRGFALPWLSLPGEFDFVT